MNKEDIIKYASINFCTNNIITERIILNFEEMIDKYFSSNELDEELIIYEALALLIVPVADYPKSLKLLNQINTPRSIILRSAIFQINEGYIPSHLIDELHIHIEYKIENYLQSAILFMLSKEIDNSETEIISLLNKSIERNPKSVLPYIKLGDIYLNKMDEYTGKKYILKGLSNIEIVTNINSKINYISFNRFINEHFIGNVMTDVLYNSYKSHINK